MENEICRSGIDFAIYDKDDNLITWGENDTLLYTGHQIRYIPRKDDMIYLELDKLDHNFGGNPENNGTVNKKRFLELFHCSKYKYLFKNLAAKFRVKEVHFLYDEDVPRIYIEVINVL